MDEAGRKAVDMCLREIEPAFPSQGTVYDYYVDVERKTWKPWKEKLNKNWKPKAGEAFFKITVPTIDTIRNEYIVATLAAAHHHILLVGGVGNGKTSVANAVIANMPSTYVRLAMNMSAQTSSNNVQGIIEGKLEKRTKDNYGPPGGRKMISFVDDLNMPQKDTFGSHPPLELLRQWIEYGFFYDREKQQQKFVKDMQLLAAMGPPGGGRTFISRRMQMQFHVINISAPSEEDLTTILQTLVNTRLGEFEEEVKTLSGEWPPL